MSAMDHLDITCPACAAALKAPIWRSVNVSLDPSFRERVMSQELFTVDCDHCGHSIFLNYPCLYHDMDHQLMLWYLPGGAAEVADLGLEVPATYTCRVVYQHDALLEKILIGEEGLDDRILEIIKAYMLTAVFEQKPDFQVQSAYFVNDENHGRCFVVFDRQGEHFLTPLQAQSYQDVAAVMTERLPQSNAFQVIDLQWALEQIKSGR